MGFTSPQQMRAALCDQIGDAAFLDRMIAEYFRENKPEPLPVEAPINGYVPLSYKEPAKSAIARQDDNLEADMAEGSRILGEAIETMLRGGTPDVPRDLMWRGHGGTDGGQTEWELKPRPVLKVSTYSVPCTKCGAARSCKHRGGE